MWKRLASWPALTAAGVVLAVSGALVLVLWPSGPRPPSLPLSHQKVVAGTPSPQGASPPAAATIPVSKPVRIVIASIGVNAPVEPVGLCPQAGMDCSGVPAGALAAPPLEAPNVTGWWSGGGYPGQAGTPAVIDGHVDSAALGPMVFWKISNGQLEAGSQIEVDLASGAHVVFTVTSIVQAAKAAFPTHEVYGATTVPALRLITCGGTFDPATGHYESNDIVFATEA